MEEHWNAGKDLYILALDIKKAFDTVKVQNLREILLSLNVPSRLVDRVIACIKDEMTRVLWDNQLSSEIKRGKGIKQGCPISPILFNYIMQDVIRNVAEKIPEMKLMNLNCLKIPLLLAFADDIIIIAKSKEELEKLLKELVEQLSIVGLELNYDKCQLLLRFPNNKTPKPQDIKLNGRQYKVCDKIRYLGVCLTDTLDRKSTNRLRCVSAYKTSRVVIEFCKKFKPSWDIGKLIYKTVLSPAITYGNKAAVLTKKSRIGMANYEKLILRNIFNNCKKPLNLKFNARKLLDGKTVNRRVRVGRINYYGHILRRENNHPIKLAYKMRFETKKEGRPSLTWKDSLNNDLNRYNNIDTEEWKQLAKDRDKLKSKAEEIYKETNSEISDGQTSEEEDDRQKPKYKHWKRKLG